MNAGLSSAFIPNVLTVAGGTAVAQLIGLLTLPLITRLYSPEVYGSFVVFLAYGGIVVPIVCARYEVAIALPRHQRSASALVIGSLAVAAGMAALTAVVVAVLASVSSSFAGGVAWSLPLYVLLGGVLQVFTNWHARNRNFPRLARSRIVQTAVSSALAIGLAFALNPQAMTLVVATLAGQTLALLVLLAGLPRSGFTPRLRPRLVLRLMRHFRRLVAFNVPHVLSDAAQSSGLPLLIAAMFGPQAAAYYSFSTRLLKTPLGLVNGSISQVYYPRAASHRNDDHQLRHDALRILGALSLVALLALPAILLVPDSAYTLVFGSKWSGVGAYLRALSPWMLSAFVAGPLSVLFLVKGRYALSFAFALGATLSAFLFLGAAHYFSQGMIASMWWLALGMTLYIVATTVAEYLLIIGQRRRHVS
jgi:O-antigen/teichoic acid export membrane protein